MTGGTRGQIGIEIARARVRVRIKRELRRAGVPIPAAGGDGGLPRPHLESV